MKRCIKRVVESENNSNSAAKNANSCRVDTWSLYLYSMKSPVTRQKYQKRLEKFFDFFGTFRLVYGADPWEAR